MFRLLLFLTLSLQTCLCFSQSNEVPDEMYFLDMKIYIKHGAKGEIANSVAALRKNKTYYQAKLDRVDAYFPIIEKILEEQKVPEDFKFLAIQESALVSDAVSSSNAVGFWQFKREAATEHNMRVDNVVDERKNITSSTRAAADYLKKSNAIFDNWIYSLMSYNVGRGGTQRTVNTKYYGAREMQIDGGTHWYILKTIAHKLAFAEEEGKNPAPPLFLFEYFNGQGKTLTEIANELSVQEDNLKLYNKWLANVNDVVPSDRTYAVIVPASYMEKDAIAAKLGDTRPISVQAEVSVPLKRDLKPLPEPKRPNARAEEMYPGDIPVFALHNGLEAIQAKDGDDINKLAIQGSVSKSKFLKYNDLRVFDEIVPNEYYYIEAKRNKASVPFHVVKQGENLRDISQLYGISISAIQRKNRMSKTEPLQVGRELWLRNKRPTDVPVKIVKIQAAPPKPTKSPVRETPPAPQRPLPVVRKDSVAIQPMNTVPPVAPTVVVSKSPSVSTSATKDSVHVVQQGQTLYAIARLYNTKPDSIKSWNSLDSSGIKVNQPLRIKRPSQETRSSFINHTVAQGETFYRIADIYKVPVKSIQEWNNKSDFSLSVGEVLLIKKP